MKKKWLFAGIIVILFAFSLRVYSPLSDLPSDISISGSIYTDEGNQCHNSRSKVLFGEWFPDNWKITNYNPVVPYLKFAIFKVFGVGLLQVRSVSYFFAFLSLIFFFLTLKSYFTPFFAFTGITLLGFNFLYIMYNRIGTFETPMIFWMILSLYFLEKFRVSGRSLFAFISGISAFTAFIFKMTGAHFVPVPVAAILLILIIFPGKDKANPDRADLRKGLFYLILGIFSILGLWLILFYIPNREWIKSAPGSYIGNQMFPKSFRQMFGNILMYNWKEQFYKMAPVWIASMLYIPWFVRRVIRKTYTITEAAFVLFLFSHTAALMIMNHRPTRYLIASIPPMVFLAVHFLSNLSVKGTVHKANLGIIWKIVIFISDVLWLNFFLYYCGVPLLRIFSVRNIIFGFSISNLFLTILIVVFSYIIYHFLKMLLQNRLSDYRGVFFYSVTVVFLITSFTINLSFYYRWAEDRTNIVKNISEEIGEKIEGGNIAGLTAPVAVLNSNNRSLFLYPNFVHWSKDTLKNYSVTHALVATFNNEISNFFNMWPEKMRNARLLNVYNVKDQFLQLYSFIYPFIENIKKDRDGVWRVSIINPDKRVKSIDIDVVNPNINESGVFTNVDIYPAENGFSLIPGVNSFKLKKNGTIDKLLNNSSLLYIKNKLWKRKFRYEGEKFPRKTGTDIRNIKLSGKFSRSFLRFYHKPGFIVSSNNGKFIPFSEGIMKVDFRIRIKNVKSRIRPLAIIDVFNNSEGEKIIEKRIKKKNTLINEFRNHTLVFLIKGVKDIEFRVFATGYSDVDVDYIDITYYQGRFISGKNIK